MVKGFLQKYSIDFIKIFLNTIKLIVYKALFGWAAYYDLEIQ